MREGGRWPVGGCPSLESLFVPGFESTEVELILNSRADMGRDGPFFTATLIKLTLNMFPVSSSSDVIRCGGANKDSWFHSYSSKPNANSEQWPHKFTNS